MSLTREGFSDKTLSGREATSDAKRLIEELGASTLTLHAQDVYGETFDADPAVELLQPIPKVEQRTLFALTVDPSVPSSQAWKAGLTDWVPPQFGSGYEIKFFDGADVSIGIPAQITRGFRFNYKTGILTLDNASGLTLPIKVTGYRYIGQRATDLFGGGGGGGPVDDSDITGGMRTVVDISTMNSIPVGERKVGMRVHVQSVNGGFRLAGDLTTWIPEGNLGSVRVVANVTARNAIDSTLRFEGLRVNTLDTGREYRLESDLTTWTLASTIINGTGDPNASVDADINGAPVGTYYLETVTTALYQKIGALATDWLLRSQSAVATGVTELWVDPAAGDDDNPGTSGLPLAKVQTAINRLHAADGGGIPVWTADRTIHLKAGTYAESEVYIPAHGGSGVLVFLGEESLLATVTQSGSLVATALPSMMTMTVAGTPLTPSDPAIEKDAFIRPQVGPVPAFGITRWGTSIPVYAVPSSSTLTVCAEFLTVNFFGSYGDTFVHDIVKPLAVWDCSDLTGAGKRGTVFRITDGARVRFSGIKFLRDAAQGPTIFQGYGFTSNISIEDFTVERCVFKDTFGVWFHNLSPSIYGCIGQDLVSDWNATIFDRCDHARAYNFLWTANGTARLGVYRTQFILGGSHFEDLGSAPTSPSLFEVDGAGTEFHLSASTIANCSFQNLQLHAKRVASLIQSADFSGAEGNSIPPWGPEASGIVALEGSFLQLTGVTGIGNQDCGVAVYRDATVYFFGVASTVTGTNGEVRIGTRSPDTHVFLRAMPDKILTEITRNSKVEVD